MRLWRTLLDLPPGFNILAAVLAAALVVVSCAAAQPAPAAPPPPPSPSAAHGVETYCDEHGARVYLDAGNRPFAALGDSYGYSNGCP